MSGGGAITLDSLPPEYRRPKAGATGRDREIAVDVPKDIVETEWTQDAAPAGAIEVLPALGIDLETYIERLENSLIMQALERTGNNKNQAAKLLGLNRTTLVERIKKRKLVPLNLPSKEL
jgi:DNA-binding NtrC family response regulator